MIQPHIPTHPGDVLKEEIESRGISQRRFAEMLGVSYSQVNGILNGKRPVTPDFALLVEAAMSINPEMLIRMQNSHDIAAARQKPTMAQRLNEIRKACASIVL